MNTIESEEKYKSVKSTNKYKEKAGLYKNPKVQSVNNIFDKNNNNTLNIKTHRKIKLKPINLINFYKPKKALDNIKIEYEKNSNSIINGESIKNLQNKKLKKLFFRNNSSLPYQQLSKDAKTLDVQPIENHLISNRIQKVNLLHKKNYSKINSAKSISNLSTNKRNLFSENLSDIDSIDKNQKKKKIFSSKSKSSHNIFLSNLDISSRPSGKERKKSKVKSYRKKWNLPKIISFDKITGRYKENKNPIKFQAFERMYDYSPNYKLLYYNDQKAFVKIGKENKMKFKDYKINITRKYLCNHINIINNSGDFYNILKVIKEEKEKKEKLKSKMNKKFNIIEEYKYYKDRKKFYTIDQEKRK
jgi:hypothetical protein